MKDGTRATASQDGGAHNEAAPGGSTFFWISKRTLDIVVALMLLPVFALTSLVIAILNPRLNPGRLFFVQPRMGRDCRPFAAFKFRTMTEPRGPARRADAPLELDRITRLGRYLRRTRIDELPQIVNILRGEMSLIGPRPDFFGHARVYLRAIPEYRDRHRIRPGISGLAQVTLGYAEGVDATRAKTLCDLDYIRDAGFALDAKLLWLTLLTILGGHGK